MPRRRQVGGLRYAALWIGAVLGTKSGRWAAVLGIALTFFGIPFLFPSLFPSDLKSRGQKFAQAWIARDAEQMRSFADPTLVENMPRWMEANPPPELNQDQQKADVSVAVVRNDGDTAELLIQIKGLKNNGSTAYYTYRPRWIQRNGTWYLQPDLPAGGLLSGTTGASGTSGKGR